MLTTLTEQDVLDVDFALSTRRRAAAEMSTPESILREFAYDPTQLGADMARFTRGCTLARDYVLLTSDRSVVGGQFDETTTARIVSPIVQVRSGHIATSNAYRAIALAQR